MSSLFLWKSSSLFIQQSHQTMGLYKARNPPPRYVLPWACWCCIFFWLFCNTSYLWRKESILVDIIHPPFLCSICCTFTLLSWNRKHKTGELTYLNELQFVSDVIIRCLNWTSRPSECHQWLMSLSTWALDYIIKKASRFLECWGQVSPGKVFSEYLNPRDYWAKFLLPQSES